MLTSGPTQPLSIAMKKLFLPLLVVFFSAGATRLAAAVDRADLVARVESCEAVLQEFQREPRIAVPASVLAKAKAIVIVNQFKAGFIFGVKDGYGVVMVKKPSGHWSVPVLISAGEASLGLQVGATSIETIYIITDDATPRLLFKDRFRVGVDAKAVIGPKAAEAENPEYKVLNAPVLIYTKSAGVFAGATVKAGYISRNDEANFTLYRTQYTLPELLYSDWVTPPDEVQPLMKLVQQIAP
jgi:SH3 domain-containing YSC84-like protein 1